MTKTDDHVEAEVRMRICQDLRELCGKGQSYEVGKIEACIPESGRRCCTYGHFYKSKEPGERSLS